MNKKMMIGVIAMFVAFLTQSVFALNMQLFSSPRSYPELLSDLPDIKICDTNEFSGDMAAMFDRYDGYVVWLSYYGSDIRHSRLIEFNYHEKFNNRVAQYYLVDYPSQKEMLSEIEYKLEEVLKGMPVVRNEKLKDGLAVTMYDSSAYAENPNEKRLTVVTDSGKIVWYSLREGFGDAVYTADGRYMIFCNGTVYYANPLKDKIVVEAFDVACGFLGIAPFSSRECTILSNNMIKLQDRHGTSHWKVVLSPEDMTKNKASFENPSGRHVIWSNGIIPGSDKLWNYKKGGDEPTYTDTDFHLPKAEADTL